jgi:two-component system, response regulator
MDLEKIYTLHSKTISHEFPMKSVQLNSIFIVDDDPDDRQVILDAFLENDNTITHHCIENGQDLITNLVESEGHYPEVILLDLNMHKLSGLAALAEIRRNRNYNQIAVIVLTTSTHHGDRKAAFELGANCYLNKPQTYSGLIDLSASICKLFMTRNGE